MQWEAGPVYYWCVRRRGQRDKQAGRAIERKLGDVGEIHFPDGGAQPLKRRVQKHQHRPGDGHGSHHNGKHKLG